MTIFTDKALWKREDVLLGVILVAAGFLGNYMLEHRTFLRPGILSPRGYLGAWPDLLLPSLGFFLTVSGVILLAIGVKRLVLPGTGQWRFWPAFLLAALLTIPYGFFSFGMQFVATGADRLGECSGLDQAANASGEIADSLAFPDRPAIGCAVNRYGMFLSYYNDLSVYGVAHPAAQERVVQNLREYRKHTYTHPVHIAFYEKENWTSWYNPRNGVAGGQRRPEKLLRIVT